MELIERYPNPFGGFDEYYRGIAETPELNKLFNDAYERLEKQKYEYIKKKEEINENSKYIFITINPNQHITLLDFVNKMSKMMSKKWMTNYLYVYEQRGENLGEVGKGFHFHCILEKPKTKKYSEMMRELANSANAVCDSSSFNFFNVKSVSEEEKNRKIGYIMDRKADPSKWAKQDMDIIFRVNNNLLSYYNIGIIE